MKIDLVIDILKIIISWPSIILILFLIFRKKILDLVEAKTSGISLKFQEPRIDDERKKALGEEKKPIRASPSEDIKKLKIEWGKTGNLFWAARDMMWTIDAALRNASRDIIIHGLKQSLHHLKELGFSEINVYDDLTEIKQDIEHLPNFTPRMRIVLADRITSVIRKIGAFAEENQPGYKARPLS